MHTILRRTAAWITGAALAGVLAVGIVAGVTGDDGSGSADVAAKSTSSTEPAGRKTK